jgi:hypothetical protein
MFSKLKHQHGDVLVDVKTFENGHQSAEISAIGSHQLASSQLPI